MNWVWMWGFLAGEIMGCAIGVVVARRTFRSTHDRLITHLSEMSEELCRLSDARSALMDAVKDHP